MRYLIITTMKLQTMTLATLIGVGAMNCQYKLPEQHIFQNVPVAIGYDVGFIGESPNRLSIGRWDEQENHFKRGRLIYAEDLNGDGRYDKITCLEVPQGDPLERLMSLGRIQEIRASVYPQ